MAEFPDPARNFLDSYFMARSGVQDAQLKKQQAQLAQQKFAWEQSSHAADMKQRADQFQQEMTERTNRATAEESYRKAMLDETKATRTDASQARFEDKGGRLLPTPTDTPLPFQTGGSQAPGDPSMLPQVPGLTVPAQPVGPNPSAMNPEAALQNLTQGLPRMASPAIPMEGVTSAAANQPPGYNAVPAPMGTPAGQTAYMPTQEELARQKVAGANEAHQIPITKSLAAALPDLNLTEGEQIDERQIPLFEKALEFKISKAQQASQFARSADEKDKAEADMNMYHMAMAAIAASKGSGHSLSEELISANHTSVMENPDSFDKMSKDEKSAEAEQLKKEGLPRPVTLNPTQRDQEQYARRARTSIDTIRATLADPTKLALIKKRSGAILGRVGDLEQDAGATTGLSPEDARAMQDFRASVRYLTFQEGKALFGSRIPIQLMKELQSTSPKTTESIDMLKGSMDAVNRNAENTLISDERSRWGGVKMRPGFMKENGINRSEPKEVESNVVPADKAAAMEEGVARHAVIGGADRSFVKRGGKVYEITDK